MNVSLKSLSPEFKQLHVISVKGKDFVKYAGLRALAEDRSMKCMRSTVLQYPSKENDNMAIIQAIVVDQDGNEWSAIGDCNGKNCNQQVSAHFIRVAETRAKGRALRDFLGIDAVMAEEVDDAPEENEPITAHQVERINSLIPQKGLSAEAAYALFHQTTGKEKLHHATSYEADIYIRRLGGLPDSVPATVQQGDSMDGEQVA